MDLNSLELISPKLFLFQFFKHWPYFLYPTQLANVLEIITATLFRKEQT